MQASKNVVPFFQIERYITDAKAVNPSSFNLPTSATNPYIPLNNILSPTLRPSSYVTCNTISLNQIPDKIALGVRLNPSRATAFDPDNWLPISNVQIQFNNVSGLCSTYSPAQLFEATRESGFACRYEDFSGFYAVSPAISSTKQYAVADYVICWFSRCFVIWA